MHPRIELILFLAFILLGASHQPLPDFELGKRVFFKRCKVCHGEQGNADPFAASVLNPPPRNFTTERSRRELTLERMINSVTHGRLGTAMMAWKDNLTIDEIRAVVFYIRRTFMGFSDNGMNVKH